MLDWRVWAVLIAICAFDGYSRFATESNGEGAKGVSKDQAVQLEKAGMDGGVEEYGIDQHLVFKDHSPNQLHIQYCAS
eukprot:650750-Rhodomonas_salina.3